MIMHFKILTKRLPKPFFSGVFFLLVGLLFFFVSCASNKSSSTPLVKPKPEVKGYSVSTLAGSNQTGFSDGLTTTALFFMPYGLALDKNNNLFIADNGNNRIRSGVDTIKGGTTARYSIQTIVGDSSPGDSIGNGTAAKLDHPTGVGYFSSSLGEYLIVADNLNNKIKAIQMTDLKPVTLVAGSGTFGYKNAHGAGADFADPNGLAVHNNSGTIFVSDTNNHAIRAINFKTKDVITFAGALPGASPSFGSVNSTAGGDQVRFKYPKALALDKSGNLYVADSGNNTIRKITITYSGASLTPTFTGAFTIAGADTTQGAVNNVAPLLASFNNPGGLAVDDNTNIYVSDTANNLIRMITNPTPNVIPNTWGAVLTLAGNGIAAYGDATADLSSKGIPTASFSGPMGIATNGDGTRIFVADHNNHVIRMIKTVR